MSNFSINPEGLHVYSSFKSRKIFDPGWGRINFSSIFYKHLMPLASGSIHQLNN